MQNLAARLERLEAGRIKATPTPIRLFWRAQGGELVPVVIGQAGAPDPVPVDHHGAVPLVLCGLGGRSPEALGW